MKTFEIRPIRNRRVAVTRRFLIPINAVAALAGLGCSSSPSDPFPGTWLCSGTSMVTYTQPPNVPPSTGSTISTVVITDDGSGTITLARTTVQDAGTTMCSYKAVLSSNQQSFTLSAGDTCVNFDGNTMTYTSGTGTLMSPTTFSIDSTWTLSGQTASGAPLSETGTTNAACSKM
jgi:hypothetical protein